MSFTYHKLLIIYCIAFSILPVFSQFETSTETLTSGSLEPTQITETSLLITNPNQDLGKSDQITSSGEEFLQQGEITSVLQGDSFNDNKEFSPPILDNKKENIIGTEINSSPPLIGGEFIPSQPIVEIIELFPKDTTLLGEYLILKFFAPYSGEVRISGLGQGSAEKSFTISAYSGMSVVVTDIPTKITAGGYIVVTINSIILTDTGEPLQVFLGSGTSPVDKIIYSTSSSEKALFWGGELNGSGYRIFSVFGDPTVISNSPPPTTTGGTNQQTGACSVLIQNILPQTSGHFIQAILSGSALCSNSLLSRSIDNQTYHLSGCSQSFFHTGVGYLTISIGEGGCIPIGVYLPFPKEENVCSSSGENTLYSGSIPKIEITEIHAYDTDQFPEYIELLFHEAFSGHIQIDGLGVGGAMKEFSVQVFSGSYIVITDLAEKFSSLVSLVVLSSISLTDGGEELVVRSQLGQEIDRVVYSGHDKIYSVVASLDNSFMTGLSNTGFVRGFGKTQSPTPGFERGLITHLFSEGSGVMIPLCGIDFQHSTPLYASNKVNLQAMIEGGGITNSSSLYQCEWLLTGSDLVYATGCNPGFIGYETPGVYEVVLRIWKGETPVCNISQEINLPAKSSGGTCQATVSTSQSTYYEGLYRKWKGRYDLLKDEVKVLGYKVGLSGDILEETLEQEFLVPEDVFFGDILRIAGVVANPVGRDTEGEVLQVENLTKEPIITDDLILQRGTTTKKLPENIILPPHQIITLTGNLGLTNKPTCISIRFRKKNQILSTFCYPQPQEGVLFTQGLVGIESQEDSQLLSALKIDIQDTQTCVIYEDQELLCKQFPFGIQEAKAWKKSARKTPSLEKKIVTLQGKYDLWREKYATQSKGFKTKETGYKQRASTLREDVRLQRQATSIYRQFYSLLKNELLGDLEPLLGPRQAVLLDKLYGLIQEHTAQESISLGPIDLSPALIQERYDLLGAGKLPLHEFSLPEVITYLRDRTEDQLEIIDQIIFDFNPS